jgi:CBS domain-containing protein
MPAIVNVNATLDEVARAMLSSPASHVACVVSDDGMLKGLLSLDALTDDLFYHILPEEFIKEITDMEKMLSFADKSRLKTAGDAMSEPHWVRHGETLKDAFIRMHKHKLPGIPVVDEQYHVVGYINQLELLGICLDDPQMESKKTDKKKTKEKK